MEPSIQVSFSINADSRNVHATLRYLNASAEPVFIDRINGCLEGKIENDVFRISSEGRRIKYVGILQKRREPTANDFVKIPPGGHVDTAVTLDSAYDFLPGPHQYSAKYSAFHQFPDRPGFIKIESNEVTFSFDKPSLLHQPLVPPQKP